jgi:copper ion binding protein
MGIGRLVDVIVCVIHTRGRQKYMAEIQEITLSVPDVSCEHCVRTINGALGNLPGVQEVSTDIPTKTVHLRYDPQQVTVQKVETALDDAGYTVAR